MSELNFITVYTCDVCKRATFETHEEAEVHERTCRGPGNATANNGPNNSAGVASGQATNSNNVSSQQTAHIQPLRTDTTVVSGKTSLARITTPKANPAATATKPKGSVVNQTLYKCNRCKILFWNETQARIHEKICTSPPYFSCKVCGILRFPTNTECQIHEHGCRGARPLAVAQIPLAEHILGKQYAIGGVGGGGGGGGGGVANQSAPKTATSAPEEDDSSVEVLSVAPAPSPGSLKSSNVETTSEKAEVESSRKSSADETASENADTEEKGAEEENFCTVWTCDKCNEKQFDTYEEAEEHEKICPGPSKIEKSAPQSNSPQSSTTGATSFVPILGDKHLYINRQKVTFDSLKSLSLSTYYCQILQCINLVCKPGSSVASVQCNFCSHTYPNAWTIDTIVKSLPTIIVKHLRTPAKGKPGEGCSHVPSDKLEKVLEHERTKYSGKPKFEDFMKKFFAANGVVEKAIKIGTSTVYKQLIVLSDVEFKKSLNSAKGGYSITSFLSSSNSPTGKPGVKKKRDDVANTKSKRQKMPRSRSLSPVFNNIDLSSGIECGNMGAKLHSDENGDQFYLPPLDGIPLISSFSLKECKMLHKSYQTLLDQVEFFTLVPKLSKLTDETFIPQSVGIRCQNCIASQSGCCFRRVSSVSSIAEDIVLMGMKHLVSCNCTESGVQDEMKTLSMKDADHLKDYCNRIAKLYSLVDKQGKESSAAVWGESSAVPQNYSGHPIDIDLGFAMNHPISNLTDESKTAPMKIESSVTAKSLETA